MAKWNWENCLSHTKISEGGYVNDPVDPGGETKYGISKRSYPDVDIKNLTWDKAAAIYKRDYWDAVRGDDLPSGVDLVAFDAAVNSGVSRGAKWLQKAVGVTQDGRIGPVTIDALIGCDCESIINAACSYRLQFMRGLPTWYRFKNGWTKRVECVRSEATNMSKADEVVGNTGGINWYGLILSIMGMFKK